MFDIKEAIKAKNEIDAPLEAAGNCWFGHKWSKWEQQTLQVQYSKGAMSYTGFEIVQARTCLRCGRFQTENLEFDKTQSNLKP